MVIGNKIGGIARVFIKLTWPSYPKLGPIPVTCLVLLFNYLVTVDQHLTGSSKMGLKMMILLKTPFGRRWWRRDHERERLHIVLCERTRPMGQ
jgi:hypothetical protein